MKKIAYLIFILCLPLVFTSPSMSQDFRLGLTGSPSLAWLKPETDNYSSEGIRLGFSYGLLSEFILAEQYSFATGINITYMGGKLQFPVSETFENQSFDQQERTYKLQYVEVPLTLKMKTREIGYNTFFAVFGFGGAVRIKATGDDKFTHSASTATFSESGRNIESDISLFRVAMILGLGVEHSLGGTTSLIGGITFNNGFTNILDGKDYEGVKDKNARPNYLELSIGVLF